MTGGGQTFERDFADRERRAEMFLEVCLWTARDFDGGELPHTGEQNRIVRTGVLNQQRAAARIAENCGGDFHVDRGAFAAWRGDFGGEALCVGAAVARYGAFRAARRLRRAGNLTQFHKRLVPIAGGLRRKKTLRGGGEGTPIFRSAQVAADGLYARQDASDVAVEYRERNIVSDAQHRGSCVDADAGKVKRGGKFARELSVVARGDNFRSAM